MLSRLDVLESVASDAMQNSIISLCLLMRCALTQKLFSTVVAGKLLSLALFPYSTTAVLSPRP